MSSRVMLNAAAGYAASIVSTAAPSDPYYDNVSLLLTGDTEVDTSFANVSLLLDGNTLTDKSNNKLAVTAYGNAAVTSTVKKFGTGSYYFDGTGDYIGSTTNLNLGTSSFTIECWFNIIDFTGSRYLWVEQNQGSLGNNNIGNLCAISSTGYVYFGWNNGTNQYNVQTTTGIIKSGQWYHIACVRDVNTFSVYVNGTLINSTTSSVSINSIPNLYLGRYDFEGDSTAMKGYIDDFRITKGVARYTANFTPPVKALPTHEILDSSVYRLPVTAYGNARIDTATKKYGTGAMYFDGSGDYLDAGNNTNLQLSGDFTIEFWVNPDSGAATYGGIVGKRNQSNFTDGVDWVIQLQADGTVGFGYSGGGAYWSMGSYTAGQWTHHAITRSGTSIQTFKNGTSVTTATSSYTWASTVSLLIGRNDPTHDFKGFIDDLRITKGIARTITPPSASLPTIPPTIPADPLWSNVSLLLDGNTTDAYDPYWQNVSLMLTGDDFIDWSNQHNAVTNNGTVTLDTTNKKFNSSSLSFNGSSQYFNLPSASGFNTDNFTIELWIRPSSVNTTVSFISNRVAGAADTVFVFGYSNAANVGLFFHTQNTVILNTNTFLTQNSWQHVAAVRISGNLKIYLDGNLVGTAALSQNLSSTNALYIAKDGTKSDGGQTGLFAGQIADLRITKGVARTITVPTAALPAFKIQDRTQNNLTLTPSGNVQLSTDVMKNGTGSMFFDGTGDYLTVTTSPTFNFGTGDFTVEMWVNPTSVNSIRGLFATSGGAGAGIPKFVVLLNSGTPSIHYNGFTNGANIYTTATAAIAAGVWTHLAFVRTGSTWVWYINGIAAGTGSNTSDITFTSQPTYAGYGGETGFDPFNGYIDDFRITKGYARYTQNFTPPSQSFANQYISTGYDANYADVSLLLNGNGTNGSQVFTDLSSTPKTITSTVTSISTAVKKYGTGSLYFGGTNAGLKATYGPQTITGDFTFECWAYPTAKPELYPSVFGTGDNWVDNGCIVLFAGHNYWGSTKYQFCWYGMDSGGNPFIQSSSTIVYNAWTHIALVRKGTTYTLYLNGVADGSCTNSRTVNIETVISAGGGFNGYMDDFRFSRIARYTTNFTPPTYQLPTDTTGTVIDPLRASTSLLLRGNGTNGSTSFNDESPNGLTVTNNGSVTVNTTTKKYGTGSMAFSGSNYLSIASSTYLALPNEFTIECWVYCTAAPVYSVFLAITDGIQVGLDVNGYLAIALQGVTFQLNSTSTVPLNIWNHIAVTRNTANAVNIYLNGISVASGTIATSYSAGDAYINYNLASTGSKFTGYLDDLRITKGYARYTTNFTPPTYEDPIVTGTVYDYNYPQVSLLLNGDGTNGSTVFKDLSSSPKTITVNGTAQISTSVKKFGTGSMAFDGSGDYLSMPSVGNVGTSDLTVDAWVNLGTSPGGWGHPLIDTRATNGASTGFAVQIESNGVFGIYTGSGYAGSTATGIFTFNTWHHIAVVRNNSTWKCFIDGAQILTFTNSNNFTDTTCLIGTNQPQNGALQGYIDDLRITKGLARYTANFTPPTAPLPVSGGY